MMMIRSQDQKTLMPVGCLYVGEYGAKKFCIENAVGDFSPFIGSYESEARCLEILDEIQSALNRREGRSDVYQMPEK